MKRVWISLIAVFLVCGLARPVFAAKSVDYAAGAVLAAEEPGDTADDPNPGEEEPGDPGDDPNPGTEEPGNPGDDPVPGGEEPGDPGTDPVPGEDDPAEPEVELIPITEAELKYDALTYNGKARTQSGATVVKAVVDGETRVLKYRTDYTISYRNNVEHGKATMVIEGIGAYTGTIEKTFRIARAPIKSAVLQYSAKKYTGSELTPRVTVRGKYLGELVKLKKGRDFTVAYRKNVNPGTAVVVIKGTGNYTGTIKKTFVIKPLRVTELSAGDIVDAAMIRGIKGDYFKAFAIRKGSRVYKEIIGKSYRANPDVALSDLRYIRVLHYNFDHEIQVGELIVNKAIAKDVIYIFKRLFREEYEIYSMYLIDRFWTGDAAESDKRSCHFNNTSAFCYRAITSGRMLSRHAYGMAIDINPQNNPYVWYSRGVKKVDDPNSRAYIDRTSGDPHVIVKGDICHSLFTKFGFTWGGDWQNPMDYQHFEK